MNSLIRITTQATQAPENLRCSLSLWMILYYLYSEMMVRLFKIITDNASNSKLNYIVNRTS